MTTADSGAKMIAARKVERGVMEVSEFDRPIPGDGEVLVRIERAAICGSDLHAIFDDLGPLIGDGDKPEPGRPGHECVGTVVRSNSSELAVGQRVMPLNFGAFAQYIASPAGMCLPLPDDQPLDRMLMNQQLAVTLFAMQRFWPDRSTQGKVATLIGAGSVGQHFLTLLKYWGFERILVSDIVPQRIELARAQGAEIAVDARTESIVDATMELTDGRGADLVIEAVGYDETRNECARAVASYGRIGMFGYPESYDPSPFAFADAFWKAPVTIEIVKGAQWVPGIPAFHEALNLIVTGQIDVSYLLGTEYPLTEIEAALKHARAAESIKVQLLPGV